MKKCIKIILIIIAIIIILGVILFIVDYNRVNNNQNFTDETEEYNNNLNIENNEGITITIEIIGLSDVNNTKTYTLNQAEANEINNIINNAIFSSETCDGLMSYSIKYNYEDESKNKSYGIEDYDDEYHILSSNNIQTVEAIISGKEKEQLDNIINKYFK